MAWATSAGRHLDRLLASPRTRRGVAEADRCTVFLVDRERGDRAPERLAPTGGRVL